ncbi:MAG: nuclear transport factor 2 family protein [Chloroflexi bacterium]|nr:nuclear transport factor 2 family protein [Chloroflexota bacterium]OJW05328.1 MAG: hypothetical protein BGO39_33510 [Chloroflexi bacterium 54-19]
MPNKTEAKDYFRAWQNRDWDFVESHLAPGFTFSSQYDDHIGQAEYKQKCWEAVREIGEYEFIRLIEDETEAIVRYRCRINGAEVHNMEHLVFEDGKLKEVNVFFGRP